ncbi:MAG TPA: PEP/pyruvate-binding domain-containing protein [Candidatus Omnitrophota bacterium]|nr:PEP/pyruvate-binding domain-containing protein [Candidatus Omnitrophota bacterium]
METTGLPGLDKVINGLRLGDNVVWQIDAISDYMYFVRPFVKQALADGKLVVYLRFAAHPAIFTAADGVTVYTIDAYSGFESFSSQVNAIATRHGTGVYYVFDCLSDLLPAWSNDLMIGNFFKITCPYLYELDTIAYFSIMRNKHSFKTVARIRETTQLLIDVYNYKDDRYIHPLKVWNRYSPTMFLPHMNNRGRFVPIANSVDTAKLFSAIFSKGAKSTKRNLDYWDRLFLKAEDLAAKQGAVEEKARMVEQLCRIMIAREEKALSLARENFTLEDLLNIKARMIGTGFIGGKSVGMLVARNILLRDAPEQWNKLFEPHDSFYVGSDVFYTYIVENGWWKLRMEQKTKQGYFSVAESLREKMLNGVFPDEIKEQFQQMIEYFGQSPIIVRSSSLLEDGFGNIFAGKYESVFLVNQGTPEERYARFVDAVRRIFSSTMNKDALTYRLVRGLDQADEQMALLVQRVSGSYRSHYFFPDLAGVGISYNTYVWKEGVDPNAGMLRLVAGLGTRAVNRVEGDYPRIVALDEPLLKPHAGLDDTKKYSQHEVDVLDLEDNRLKSVAINDLAAGECNVRMDLLGTRDEDARMRLAAAGRETGASWILTFDGLFRSTPLVDVMAKLMKTLEKRYGYPVDIEYTVNFKPGGSFQINLLQCRPMPTKGIGKKVEFPSSIDKANVIFQSVGGFLGGNISQLVRRVIIIDPREYSRLTQSGKYDIGRAVGELNRLIKNREELPCAVFGPGRWGTTTPSLGVPVSFSQISNFIVLGEVAFSEANCCPELSFGTHFFQDLVETGIFYVALMPKQKGCFYNTKLIAGWPNVFKKLVPEYSRYDNVIKVFEAKHRDMRIIADIVSQRIVFFLQ